MCFGFFDSVSRHPVDPLVLCGNGGVTWASQQVELPVARRAALAASAHTYAREFCSKRGIAITAAPVDVVAWEDGQHALLDDFFLPYLDIVGSFIGCDCNGGGCHHVALVFL